MRVIKDFEEPREKKKVPWFKIISCVFAVIFTLMLGYLAIFMEWITLVQGLECIVVIAISIYGSVIIHELGHCFGGTLCKYRFGYLRIGKKALCLGRKEEDERAFVVRQFKIPHSLGGCFMVPPRGVPYEDVPYAPFFLGGGISNLLAIPVCFLFYFPFPETWYVLVIFSFISFLRGIMSLVPSMRDGVANDAQLLKLCQEDPETHRCFLGMMCILGEYAKGKSVGDMPEVWFLGKYPLNEAMPTNPILASVWGATADRFAIRGERFEAKVIYEAMGHAEDLLPILRFQGLYSLLSMMMLEGRIEEAKIYDIPHFIQKQERKLEPHYLFLARYRFGHGKLISDSTRNRNLALSYFEKISSGYPFPGHEQDQRTLLGQLDEVERHYGLWGV